MEANREHSQLAMNLTVDSTAFESKVRRVHALSCSCSLTHSHSCLDSCDDPDTMNHNIRSSCSLLVVDFDGIGNSGDEMRVIIKFEDDVRCMKVSHLKPMVHSPTEVSYSMDYFDDTNAVHHLV